MSISSLQSSIQRAHNDIASLTNKLSSVTSKLSEKSRRLADAQNAASRASSASTQQGKLREIASTLKDISSIEKEKAAIEKKIGDKKRDLHRLEQDLAKEQSRETKKMIDADTRRRKELNDYQRKLTSDLVGFSHPRPLELLQESVSSPSSVTSASKYDLFISHASEDKESFARPLAAELTNLGLNVWYDETTLTLGDSLRQSIDRGLANSRFGVVVLSHSFFAKNWPQYELNGMVAREMNGVKVILPIWHMVSKDEVLNYSPAIADKIALNSSMFSIAEIAQKLAEVVNPQ